MDTQRQLQLDQFDAEAFAEAARDYAQAKAAKEAQAEAEKQAATELSGYVPSREQADFDVVWGFTGKVDEQTYDVTVTRPVATEWDQEVLERLVAEAPDHNIDLSEIVKVEYRVDTKALKKAPVEVKSYVHKARTLSPYTKSGELRAPKITVKSGQ